IMVWWVPFAVVWLLPGEGGATVLSLVEGRHAPYYTSGTQGPKNYYMAAIAKHGEPPGVWWGAGAAELGFAPGSEVNAKVFEKLYSTFLDPRSPDFFSPDMPDDEKERLGRRPPHFKTDEEWYAVLLEKNPG